ncbi:hypothetical protein OsI_05921 [Oryza sativa Indica Group]|uniref:Uncharacterized protein n=1 Tax=Oryza sativa subsp. indica TaxID=39946 RepID=A2X140_ORYSI|nr:hypothetical protein OsI_05921 [Oryza sativa Indica Group]
MAASVISSRGRPWKNAGEAAAALDIGFCAGMEVAAATSSHSSTVESWGVTVAAAAASAGALGLPPPRNGGSNPAADEDCRSYCGSSSSVLCEDGASGAGDEAAAPRCSPLPFDLNLPASSPSAAAAAEADEMDWRCDTLLHL